MQWSRRKVKKQLRQKQILKVLSAYPEGLSQLDVSVEAEKLFKTPYKVGVAFKPLIRNGFVEEVWVNSHSRLLRMTLKGKQRVKLSNTIKKGG